MFMFIIGHRRFGKALGLKEKRSANNALFTTINFIEKKLGTMLSQENLTLSSTWLDKEKRALLEHVVTYIVILGFYLKEALCSIYFSFRKI